MSKRLVTPKRAALGVVAIAATLVGVLAAGASGAFALSVTSGPTPATAASIVLTQSDVSGVLHEHLVPALDQMRTITTPTQIFRSACVGLDTDGIGAVSGYDVQRGLTQTAISSTVIVRSSSAAVARDFRVFRSSKFPHCDFTGQTASLHVSALRFSLPGSSATIGWRIQTSTAAPTIVNDWWMFAIGRDEISLESVGSADLTANAASRFMSILLARAAAQPH